MGSHARTLFIVFIMTGAAAAYKGQVAFTLTDSKTLTPHQPQLFTDPGWSGVENFPACAYKTFRVSSYPLGFFYNKSRKHCTAVLGFGEPDTEGSREVTGDEGQLYIFKMDCPVGFQLFKIDEEQTCLYSSNYTATYGDATCTCKKLGGYLVAVKTRSKTDLVRKFSKDKSIWIGLDDIVQESQFVWQSDGSVLDESLWSDLFISPEPNGGRSENCARSRWENIRNDLSLNDFRCDEKIRFVCEADLR